MAGIDQWFGDDVSFGVTGDIETVDGDTYAKQLIIRRLLTTPGTWLQHPTYGAGLRTYIGENLSKDTIDKLTSFIPTQMYLESSVSQNPKPIITITPITQNAVAGFTVEIYYYDNAQQKQYLSFPVTR